MYILFFYFFPSFFSLACSVLCTWCLGLLIVLWETKLFFEKQNTMEGFIEGECTKIPSLQLESPAQFSCHKNEHTTLIHMYMMVVGSSPNRDGQFFFEKWLFWGCCVVWLCLSVVLLLPCLSQHLMELLFMYMYIRVSYRVFLEEGGEFVRHCHSVMHEYVTIHWVWDYMKPFNAHV